MPHTAFVGLVYGGAANGGDVSFHYAGTEACNLMLVRASRSVGSGCHGVNRSSASVASGGLQFCEAWL